MTAQQTTANADAIKVMSANSSRAVFDEVMPQFERASGHKVSISYDTGNMTMDRINSGEIADVVILNVPTIDKLAKEGKVAGRRYDLARCGIGVAVRAGAPKPDIGSVEAFKRTLLNAKSVAYTGTGASGVYFAGLIERLGIAEQVKAKSRTRPGGLIGELLVTGEAELAVQQVPELKAVAGIQFAGPLPQEVQVISIVSAGVFANAPHPDAGHALLKFLSSPAAARVFKARGFEAG